MNPGQSDYHQRATRPFPGTTSFEFNLKPAGGVVAPDLRWQPIHVYVRARQLRPGHLAYWSANITSRCASDEHGLHTAGRISGHRHHGQQRARGCPGVGYVVHLDYALKGQPPRLRPGSKTPKTHGPFQSDIKIKVGTAVVGTSTAQAWLLGRGKKVTVIYGFMANGTGDGAAGNSQVRNFTTGAKMAEPLSRARSTCFRIPSRTTLSDMNVAPARRAVPMGCLCPVPSTTWTPRPPHHRRTPRAPVIRSPSRRMRRCGTTRNSTSWRLSQLEEHP